MAYACQKTIMAINHAKEKTWRGVLQYYSNTDDENKLWTVIKSLNGTPENNSANETMIHNDRLLRKQKESWQFRKTKCRCRKIDMSKEDNTENRNLKISLQTLRKMSWWRL